ncbi:DNA-deoxyinosine glycosylase [Anaerosacchariphilus polymeriproducens]|uniref:DNA-deoxyinosine glycosylase n=1 Tax=Anaerosacchariphilus polymeriproducens TaxID=1812858 RepID=A0A371ASJ1_9FIRM|nr:DNA-deoxyinosine glycosylase [Anaerosacchariphilus polymeriproducens]RDU22538.1 DNA-deoxyinosine glycosylase [Anaerosacchariphilus polymeriproducens]
MIHTFEPIYNQESKILILGTFPSVKSREGNFYYHHPRNRFWRVLSSIIGVKQPETIEDKKNMLLQNCIAIWDVIYSCDIKASSDSSIQNVVPNDIANLLNNSNIETIYANGGKSYELYNRYCYKNTKKDIIKLPSTSPANASYSLDKLIESWSSAIQLELL